MKKVKMKRAGNTVRCTLITVLLLAASTGAGLLFRIIGFHEVNIVIIYILSVLLTARFTRAYVYGIAASLAATVTFNFIFTEPYYTLSVNDPSHRGAVQPAW